MKTLKFKVDGVWTNDIELGEFDDVKLPFERCEAVIVKEEMTLNQFLDIYPDLNVTPTSSNN